MKADCSNLYLKSMTYTFHIDDMGYQVAIIYTLELPVYHDAVSGLRGVTPQSKPRERTIGGKYRAFIHVNCTEPNHMCNH